MVSPRYFRYFPTTIHTNQQLIDITRRVNAEFTILRNPYIFLPYTIEGEIKPEDVAQYYYGDMRYTWLVYISAGVFDPYMDWPLTDRNLDRTLKKIYETLSGETGQAVLDWMKNTEITDNIVHYRNVEDNSILISKSSFSLNPYTSGS